MTDFKSFLFYSLELMLTMQPYQLNGSELNRNLFVYFLLVHPYLQTNVEYCYQFLQSQKLKKYSYKQFSNLFESIRRRVGNYERAMTPTSIALNSGNISLGILQQIVQNMQSDVKIGSMQQKSKVKNQERQAPEFQCSICAKTYPKQADLDAHIKLKHDKPPQKQKQVIKPKPNKVQPRNRVLEMQQNDHEDTIYSYLGELGEKNQQNTSRQDLQLVDQNQRQAIQTNYSFNKVVRTPYEKQLVTINAIPKLWIQKSPHEDFINVLVVQMTLLYHALEAEKDKWQFRDPMAPEEEAEDEFSLMQIRKLILNYPRRKLTLKYPHFSIFLLWVGRICKAQAWEQFFVIISYYLSEYYSREWTGKNQQEKWEKFNVEFQSEPLKSYVLERLSICDEKTAKKFAEFFNKWTVLFQLANDFC